MIPHELLVFPGEWLLIVAVALALGVWAIAVFVVFDMVAARRSDATD